MLELAEQTNIVADAIPRGARIGFVDYPMHINVGDLLILLGALDFFRWNANEIHTSFCIFDQTRAAYDRLEQCDVIVCHGGGNFGDIYTRHQGLRETIVARFAHKPVVVMPQSVHFSNAAAMERSAAVFRAHPNVTVFSRDEYSHEIIRTNFTDKVALSPDMAHRLYDSFSSLRDVQADPGVPPLRLMRKDVEAVSSDERNGSAGNDWRDILTPIEKARIGQYRVATQWAGMLGIYRTDHLNGLSRALEAIVPAVGGRLVRHGAWATSRLHGAIFGLLLGRDVTLFDNSYGKNSRYFSLWGNDLLSLAQDRSRAGRASPLGEAI